jgi:hypothetical protein
MLQASKTTYIGLFFVTLSTLMFEVLITRIFSVTMWYHFAFIAISVAMFGMTAGAIIVYLNPKSFAVELTNQHLCKYATWLGVSFLGALMIYLLIPVDPGLNFYGFLSVGSAYLLFAVPFTLSGIVICLALTRFPNNISKLYAIDLLGAACGSISIVALLNFIDAPSAVAVIGALGCVGAFFFSRSTEAKLFRTLSIVLAIMLASFAALNNYFLCSNQPSLRVLWVKGAQNPPSVYERWNPFSYIQVFDVPSKPLGWGLSANLPARIKIAQKNMLIDALAATPMTNFNGDLKTVEFLKYDVTNFAHYIKPNSDVCVIGVGGGRDVLSALEFNQKSVLGVEINNVILDILRNKFAEFLGRLADNPKVTLVNEEGRSYLTRSSRQFDIIEASLVDTWAATSAGAFTLTENALYTTNNWHIMLGHLSNDGLITFSRWHTFDRKPTETYRVFNLACVALRNEGILDPAHHIMVVVNRANQVYNTGISNTIVCKSAFTKEQIQTAKAVANQMGFEILFDGQESSDKVFDALAGNNAQSFVDNYFANISAPTDDSPFFFNTMKFANTFSALFQLSTNDEVYANAQAVTTLAYLLIAVFVLTGLAIVLPLVLAAKAPGKETWPLITYFCFIGTAFMLVEVSQMQRLSLFLGHPTYGLSVVLSTLLLAGGIGSYLTNRLDKEQLSSRGLIYLISLVVLLLGINWLTPIVTTMFLGCETALRILTAVCLLLPMGVLMGMAFPLGMKLANLHEQGLTPWLWGLNGATSVCASVLSVSIALALGIQAAFLTGILFYGLASVTFALAAKTSK